MCCALEECGRKYEAEPGPGLAQRKDGTYGCVLCYLIPLKFAPVVPCPKETESGPCRFVKGHRYECKSIKQGRAKDSVTDTRDGQAEIKRRDPTFVKRRRVGPHR